MFANSVFYYLEFFKKNPQKVLTFLKKRLRESYIIRPCLPQEEG